MIRTRTVLLAASVVATSLSAARAEFTPIAGFDRQIFPSYLIATASIKHAPEEASPTQLGDSQGQFGAEVVAPADDSPIRVEVRCEGYLEPSVYSGVLPKKGTTYRVCPAAKYRYAALARCTQTTPATATFRVQVGDAVEEEQSVTCIVRAINDCPFALSQDGEVLDVSYTFAAYVNEQHPFVDKLLREALDIGVVKSFDGYQSGPKGALLQAYALWDLLVARRVQYSSITVSAARSASVGSQHVRLIEQSINNSQANCVDGSVLWASLMQKIGIDSFLVIEPTHCYAGFYLDPEHELQFAIETTLVGGEVDGEDIEIPELLDEAISEDVRDEYSFPSFAAAMMIGTAKLEGSLRTNARISSLAEASENEGADSSDPGDEDAEGEKGEKEEAPPVQIIDIPEARRIGILPIAFQNSEEFVWYDYTSGVEEEMSEEELSEEEMSEDEEMVEDEEMSEDEEMVEDEGSYEEEDASYDEDEEAYDEDEESYEDQEQYQE
jgi:hypothetical protein